VKLLYIVLAAFACVCLVGAPAWDQPPAAQNPGSATDARADRPRLLIPLYSSFAVLQALDVHSTTRALDGAIAVEGNPMMKGIVGQPVAFAAMKAGTAAGIIYAVEKLRKTHPRAAVILMTGLNSAYISIVAHNYSLR
jgi:hypothetical protein